MAKETMDDVRAPVRGHHHQGRSFPDLTVEVRVRELQDVSKGRAARGDARNKRQREREHATHGAKDNERETLRRALAKFRRKMKTSRRGVAVDAEQAMQSALALALCRRPARTSAAVLASAAEARLPETDEAWTGTTPGMGGRTPRTRMGERQMGARRTGGRVGTGGLAVVPRLLVTEDVFLGASTVPPVRPGQDAGGGLKRYGSERSGAGSRTRGRRIFSCCSV